MSGRVGSVRDGEEGFSSAQFLLIFVFSLYIFAIFTNLLVVQYERSVISSVLADAARISIREHVNSRVDKCTQEITQAFEDVLPGPMGDGRISNIKCSGGSVEDDAGHKRSTLNASVEVRYSFFAGPDPGGVFGQGHKLETTVTERERS